MNHVHTSVKLFVVALAVSTGAGLSSATADRRLAAAKNAYVRPAKEVADDQALSECVIERIHELASVESVTDRAQADVVLTVSAHIPSATSRLMVGMMGGTPSATMQADLPDGTKLWSDGAKNRKLTGGAIGASRSATSLACGLADDLLNSLRKAMQEVERGGQK